MDLFSKLYSIDIDLREQNLSPDEFLRKRRSLSIPIWKDFRKWLVKIKHQTSGTGSELEKAMNYSLNQYRILVRYLKYAEISPDNNIAENAIRPFVVGRKNWLFNTPKGAHSSAALYSLVETAKVNNVVPDKYLNYLFSKIPEITSETDLETLMPWNMPENL